MEVWIPILIIVVSALFLTFFPRDVGDEVDITTTTTSLTTTTSASSISTTSSTTTTEQIEDDEKYCTVDGDCVPAQCCHPSDCVNEAHGPDCEGIFCTMECRPGTMDCGQGYCACVNNRCRAIIE